MTNIFLTALLMVPRANYGKSYAHQMGQALPFFASRPREGTFPRPLLAEFDGSAHSFAGGT